MRWPWVSRRAFDVLTRERDSLQEHLKHEQLRHDELFRELLRVQDEALRMKKAGYEPTPKDPPPEPDLVLPPPVAAAIDERALDTDMRRRLTGFALRALRRPDVTPEEVVAEILAGEDLEDVAL